MFECIGTAGCEEFDTLTICVGYGLVEWNTETGYPEWI